MLGEPIESSQLIAYDSTRLGYYRHVIQFVATCNACYPGGIDAIFTMFALAIADFEGRPLDISSLAATLNMPRSTVRRQVLRLESAGVLSLKREGKFTRIYRTEKAREITIPLVEQHLARLLPWACDRARARGLT